MKWCRFDGNDGPTYGLVEGDKVIQVEGDPFNGHRETSKRFALDQVKLLPPVVPPTLYAGGLN